MHSVSSFHTASRGGAPLRQSLQCYCLCSPFHVDADFIWQDVKIATMRLYRKQARCGDAPQPCQLMERCHMYTSSYSHMCIRAYTPRHETLLRCIGRRTAHGVLAV